MKKHINPFKGLVLLAIALAPLPGMAHGDNPIEKKRTITKTYTVDADDRLSIKNSFGNVQVSTWDKNMIQVDVEISVHGTSEEKAREMMDQIEVKDEQSGKQISFKTTIGRMPGNKNSGNNGERRFYVDYKVHMPAKNPLQIDNQFGKTTIPDFEGPLDVVSKFGELTTGKIARAKLINVEFGTARVGQLNNADVIFKYNSNSDIAGISGNSKVDIQFCENVNISVDNTLGDLALFQSYSSINLKVPGNLSAKFDVYTNFGSFKNQTGFVIEEEGNDDSSGPKFDKSYSGSAGQGNSKIRIKSSFGSVRLADVNDKSVDKDDSKDEDKDGDKDDDDKGHPKVNL